MTRASRGRQWRSVGTTLGAILIALVLVAAPGTAQVPDGDRVAVRSGNHASFARLVLVYPDTRRWTVLPTGTGYLVDLAGAADFDIAGVFDLIPRDRIGALRTEPGGRLSIDLACDCHVEVLELPGRGLVVDVRDGPAPPGNPFELLRPDPSQARPDDVLPALSVPLARDTAGATPQLSFGLAPVDGARLPSLAMDSAERNDAPTVPETTQVPEAPDRVLAAGGAVPADTDLAVPNGEIAPGIVELPGPNDPVLLPSVAEAQVPAVPPPPVPTTAPSVALPPSGVVLPEDARSPDRTATSPVSGTATADAAVSADADADRSAETAPTVASEDRVLPTTGTRTDAAPEPTTVDPLAVSPEPILAGATNATVPGNPWPDAIPDATRRPGRWLAAPSVAAPAPSDLPLQVDPGAAPEPHVGLPLPEIPTVPRDITTLLPLRLGPLPPTVPEEAVAAAAEFGDLLARQVGRGIAQGVVDAAVAADPPAQPAPHATRDTATALDASTEPPPSSVVSLDPLDQIEIATALDRARARERRLDLPAEAQAVCRDDAQFDIAAWGEAPGTLPDLATRRSAVIGEFDRVDPAALEAAVRYHLAYGFGAEARQLMTAFGAATALPPETVEVLRAMTYIVDGEAGDATAPLAGQLACRSRAALWGALARAQLPADADYSAEAILSAFEELPTELRRGLGPELANRFLRIGDMDTVAALRRSIARIDPPDDDARELAREPGALLDARVEAAEGRAVQSEAGLAEVARLDGPLAPEAVAELIESRLGRDELPDDALVASAAALAMERRGSEVGARLRRAEILAHVARDDFDRARDELRRAAAGAEMDTPSVAAVADAYVAAMTRRASDRAFLARLPREVSEVMGYGLTPDTRRTAAERLVALGLPEAALPLVEGLAPDEAARRIAARAWLRLGQAGTALARVAGLAGPEAERIRAEAYEALGDPGTAARVLDGLGDDAAAVAAAWRAGDLERVSQDPEAPRAGIADLVRSDDPRVPDSLAPLAEHRDLIADIARRRQAITAELARPPAPASR